MTEASVFEELVCFRSVAEPDIRKLAEKLTMGIRTQSIDLNLLCTALWIQIHQLIETTVFDHDLTCSVVSLIKAILSDESLNEARAIFRAFVANDVFEALNTLSITIKGFTDRLNHIFDWLHEYYQNECPGIAPEWDISSYSHPFTKCAHEAVCSSESVQNLSVTQRAKVISLLRYMNSIVDILPESMGESMIKITQTVFAKLETDRGYDEAVYLLTGIEHCMRGKITFSDESRVTVDIDALLSGQNSERAATIEGPRIDFIKHEPQDYLSDHEQFFGSHGSAFVSKYDVLKSIVSFQEKSQRLPSKHADQAVLYRSGFASVNEWRLVDK